jgi:hypothetical protein
LKTAIAVAEQRGRAAGARARDDQIRLPVAVNISNCQLEGTSHEIAAFKYELATPVPEEYPNMIIGSALGNAKRWIIASCDGQVQITVAIQVADGESDRMNPGWKRKSIRHCRILDRLAEDITAADRQTYEHQAKACRLLFHISPRNLKPLFYLARLKK